MSNSSSSLPYSQSPVCYEPWVVVSHTSLELALSQKWRAMRVRNDSRGTLLEEASPNAGAERLMLRSGHLVRGVRVASRQMSVHKESLAVPESALLYRYHPTQQPGGYVDCYTRTVPAAVSLSDYVYAFYTTPVFRLERWILAALVKPSTDADARYLADGKQTNFAAWRLEDRTADELLMCDLGSRTRSWFMVTKEANVTRLWFGSAVTPQVVDGVPTMGSTYRWLLPVHKMYSRILLDAAARSLS